VAGSNGDLNVVLHQSCADLGALGVQSDTDRATRVLYYWSIGVHSVRIVGGIGCLEKRAMWCLSPVKTGFFEEK
jgi:hypothetical protein